ncbi:MAG: N-terminal phage integrase SAM-like domain-containing protein [Clostridiales bacterium]|nr:N-terminal phage integrase SAM-like domain-containing protein [Clostridiales bacterium]
MTKAFRKIIKIQGYLVPARKRTTGRYKCSYELRYAKRPFNKHPLSASGPTIEIAKANFIEKLNARIAEFNIAPIIPINFDKFAIYWFDNFHKCKVIEKTYRNNFGLYERHIKNALGDFAIGDITPAMLKELLTKLPGNGKTEDDVHSLLKQIFDAAVSLKKININPLNYFVHTPHDKETGTELTRTEEITLLNAYKGSDYEIIFAVMLFCGLRPNEYKTARIEGEFIIALNSKRKNGKIEYKKIPICSHLRDRLQELTVLPKRHICGIRKNFNKLFPQHTLKDLRKTFDTRCVECKIDYYARKKFVGQSVGKLDRTYIGNLDEYLLTEGKKLDDWYTLYPKIPQKND